MSWSPLRLPASHWRQIESDIEDMCSTGDHSEIEILSQVEVVEDAYGDDPMPVFVIKGKDLLASEALYSYYDLCVANDLSYQAAEVLKARTEMRAWQARHRSEVKLPHHPHEPAAGS